MRESRVLTVSRLGHSLRSPPSGSHESCLTIALIILQLADDSPSILASLGRSPTKKLTQCVLCVRFYSKYIIIPTLSAAYWHHTNHLATIPSDHLHCNQPLLAAYLHHRFQSAVVPSESSLSSFSELIATPCPRPCESCRQTGDCVQTAECTGKDLHSTINICNNVHTKSNLKCYALSVRKIAKTISGTISHITSSFSYRNCSIPASCMHYRPTHRLMHSYSVNRHVK